MASQDSFERARARRSRRDGRLALLAFGAALALCAAACGRALARAVV